MKGFIRKGGMIAVVLCLFLTGCGTPMMTLTAEEEKQIVAYASGTVAKANKYMEYGLTYPDMEEEAPEEELPPEDTGQDRTDSEQGAASGDNGAGDVPDENVQTATLTEALNLDLITVQYKGYQITDNYVEGSYFALNAEAGMAYLIMNIGMTNTSQQPIECNLFEKNIRCSLYTNGVLSVDAMATVLLNDFTTYIGTLEASTETDMIIIFEVPQDTVQQIQSLSMDVDVDGSVYHVNLE